MFSSFAARSWLLWLAAATASGQGWLSQLGSFGAWVWMSAPISTIERAEPVEVGVEFGERRRRARRRSTGVRGCGLGGRRLRLRRGGGRFGRPVAGGRPIRPVLAAASRQSRDANEGNERDSR